MTAPEFSDAEMIAELERIAAQAERMAEIRAMYDLAPELDTTRQAQLYRAIAARLTAMAPGWQPPHEAERPDGFRCLGFITGLVDEDDEFVESAAEPEWMIVAWQVMSDLTKFWTCVDGIERRPAAFAPLPPTPTQKVTK